MALLTNAITVTDFDIVCDLFDQFAAPGRHQLDVASGNAWCGLP
jgi:hypothetical protein